MKKKTKIVHIVGARPNFVKLAPLYFEFKRDKIKQKVIHTGQHYDPKLSGIFFKQFKLPNPDFNLNVGSLSHAQQVAWMMIRLEPILIKLKPTLVIVYGDCNSTLTGALTAVKLGIPISHVEAGLRSFDFQMPEEINRVLTDRIADLLFTPSKDANINLKKEGISKSKIKFVGNIMIDSLKKMLKEAEKTNINKYLANNKNYALVTLHRPRNVDNKKILLQILNSLNKISIKLPVLFSVHPRTKKNIKKLKGFKKAKHLKLLDPVGYLEFLHLISKAKLVITDSGGIQEETTYLNISCFTLRPNTERPITVSQGTNKMIGLDYKTSFFNSKMLLKEVDLVLQGKVKKGKTLALWDGRAASRIVHIIKQGKGAF